MNEYMVIATLPDYFEEKFIEKIPFQRERVRELLSKKIMLSYSLSADRSTLWMVVLAHSRESVEHILRTLPLYEFLQYNIIELMIHNTVEMKTTELPIFLN